MTSGAVHVLAKQKGADPINKATHCAEQPFTMTVDDQETFHRAAGTQDAAKISTSSRALKLHTDSAMKDSTNMGNGGSSPAAVSNSCEGTRTAAMFGKEAGTTF